MLVAHVRQLDQSYLRTFVNVASFSPYIDFLAFLTDGSDVLQGYSMVGL